ncbi:hypothetical protein ACGFIW_33010 [Micromonospora sp. NPDC048935]|uniref:hypothetical protein n=1 Tax=Micromonospora sp. NPDC048935 TaxID=3364262 RepID=UPI0037175854
MTVVTQGDREGTSLTNAAEHYAEEVWRRLCPDEAEPPLFIAHQLLNERDLGFQQFRFVAAGRHTVQRPVRWGPRLSPTELEHLVGGPVDPSRGKYTPPPPAVEGRQRFAVALVITLPRPDLHGEPQCMPASTSWGQRLARQVAPRRQGRTCCWYHRGDWNAASAIAIQAIARTAATPLRQGYLEADEQLPAVSTFIGQAAPDPWTRDAATSLVLDPIQPSRDDHGRRFYVNGRHRSQAMLDAGVRRTHWDWPEPGGEQ